MATKKTAAPAAPQSAPVLSLADVAGMSVDETADEFAHRVRSARRLFVEQGKLVQHLRAAKLKKGQTVYGILQSRHGVSQGSIDIAIKVAEMIEAVVIPGHLPEARFDEVVTFRIANRARGLLSGKGNAKLTPQEFAALLATGDSAAIGDDMDCLTEHGVTVAGREAAIKAKEKAEAEAKAQAEAAAQAKAAEEIAAREAAETEAEANRQAAREALAKQQAAEAELAKQRAESAASLKAAEDAQAKQQAAETALAKAAPPPPAALPTATAPAAAAPAPVPAPPVSTPATAAPTAISEEPPDEESDGSDGSDGSDESDESDESDAADEEEEEDPEAALESIIDRIQGALTDAAGLDSAGIKAVVAYLRQSAAAMERELLHVRQAA
jgi:hypothetical protein